MNIYTYNNGIKCHSSSIFEVAKERYKKFINLHEPFEEMIFDHIFINKNIRTFIDIGSAWGYYSLLAKKRNPATSVIAFDSDADMVEAGRANMRLNVMEGIDFRLNRVGSDKKLEDLINEVGTIDLIKIDIQGAGTKALKSAYEKIVEIKNVILGSHGTEHDDCLALLQKNKFKIKLNLRGEEVPIQPDGIIWAEHN